MLKKILLFLGRQVRRYANNYVFKHMGLHYFCPLCETWIPSYDTFNGRKNARCPICKSLERHRAAWLFFQRKTNLFTTRKKRILHIAPEWVVRKKLKKLPHTEYITADLYRNDVSIKMDIMQISFPDNTFDIIYCSHVLEHVQDDKKAMRELARVLKVGGWALIAIPLTAKTTFEAPEADTPKKRFQTFGQSDHVRAYGLDFGDSLRDQGFSVEELTEQEVVEPENIKKFGLGRYPLFFCTVDQVEQRI